MNTEATVAAVARSEDHRFSKEVVPEIRLLAGIGIEGDAHAGAHVKHRSRVQRNAEQPNLRQIHLIEAELLEALADKGFALAPAQIGENITTHGIDLPALPLGARLRIGADACVEVTGLRTPCAQIENFQPGLLKAVTGRDAAGKPVLKSGIMGIVRAGGTVRAGDRITVEMPSGTHEPLKPV